MKKHLPWFIVGLFALWVLASLPSAPEKDAFHAREFGRLPVLLNGRIQPLDSVARNSLLQMRAKQTALLDERHTMPATAWLMELMMKPEVADERKVFRIDHPEVQNILHLAENEKHFSLNQIKPHVLDLEKEAVRVLTREGEKKSEPQLRTPLEKQIVKLYQALQLYHGLKNSLQPEGTEDFAADIDRYRNSIPAGVSAVRAREAGQTYDKEAFETILNYLSQFDFMKRMAAQLPVPLMVPPLHPEVSRDAWSSVGANLFDAVRAGEIHPTVHYYAAMSAAYRQNQPTEFNRAVADYQQWLGANQLTRERSKGNREFFFNAFAPFYKSMIIYVAAFLLACGFWFNWAQWLRKSALGLVLLGLTIHTFGLIFRMLLEGRPPVTNLYSSAIFIGWGAVILGVVLEKFYRDAIGTVTASCIGFVTLVIAHNLALGGDTMEMLRAVLDTNFWLATHVTSVTLGYASTFVAGFLAALYIVRGVLTRSLSEPTAKALQRMVYGIVCFATLFSFTGTILGGIWADQSWGRFWGWDPKENGALLIVIWNAAFLHARWGKLFPERILMALPVFGNIVTSFSWFGVNMLGIGLHSYGFMDQAFKWLVAFDVSQLLIIGLAFLPQRFWLSFRGPAAPGGAGATAKTHSQAVQARRPKEITAVR
jgi:ABC-type transport system involved in cytochrome c biogenesis permease subunit